MELERKARELAARRSGRVLPVIADAADLRRLRPGAIAEMLEPDLKEGAGGLRDLQSLEWGGWALGAPGGTATLVEREFLTADDLARVEAGRELLLDIRVALQRVTNSRSDRLALQEQDAVAAQLELRVRGRARPRSRASAARDIAWIAGDVWSRVRDLLGGPPGEGSHPIRCWPRESCCAAGRVHIERERRRIGAAVAHVGSRVRGGRARGAVRSHVVDETAGHGGADVGCLAAGRVRPPAAFGRRRGAGVRGARPRGRAHPAAARMGARPFAAAAQRLPPLHRRSSSPRGGRAMRGACSTRARSVTHRAARSTSMRSSPGPAGVPSSCCSARCCTTSRRACPATIRRSAARPPGGSSGAWVSTARAGRSSSGWCATTCSWPRSRPGVISPTLRWPTTSPPMCSGDAERLRLLYLLTIGDSRATGPAAWNPSKAALVRDLFVKAAAAIERGASKAVAADRREALDERLGAERGARLPRASPRGVRPRVRRRHDVHARRAVRESPTVRCERVDGGHVAITVVADDRPGLLVTLAGALTVCGLDVLEASLFGTTDGLALDVFRAADPFGRVADDDGARGHPHHRDVRWPARSTSPRTGRRAAPRVRPDHRARGPRGARRRGLGGIRDRHGGRGARRRRHRVALPAGVGFHRALARRADREGRDARASGSSTSSTYATPTRARSRIRKRVARLRATLVERMTG